MQKEPKPLCRPIHDPLRHANDESLTLAASWLKNGQKLTVIQRIGHSVFSLVFLLCGLLLVDGAGNNFREDDLFMGTLFAVAALFFIGFAAIGLRNVLRFNKQSQ